MARIADPAKKAPNGEYLSEIKWRKENRANGSGNTYYLSAEDHKLLRKVGRKLKLKGPSEIIRHSLNMVLSSPQ